MNKVLFVILFAFTVSFSSAQSADSTVGIAFEKGTWQETLAKAKQENKYVYVDAFTSWCGPCKWMEKNVFPQPEVGAFFNKNFVNAKFDMEKGEGIDFAKQYEVDQFPTFLYFNSDGELVHKTVGGMRAGAFIASSGDALDPEKQSVILTKRFDNGERNPEFIYKLAYVMLEARDLVKANKVAAEYLKTQTNLLAEKNVKFIGDFTISPSDPNFEFMRQNASAFKTVMGNESYEYKMYSVVYQSCFQYVGFDESVAKDQASKYIQAADVYFKKILPERAPKLSQAFAMAVYKSVKDWNKYAIEAIQYLDKNSSDWYELNTIAFSFVENVEKKEHLQKAVQWAQKSAKEYENFGNTSTAASLFYKLGEKANAKEYASKAILLGKATGEDTTAMERLLTDLR